MAEALRFLLSDDFHLNRRNFGSLFTFIEREQIPTTVHSAHGELKRALGGYLGRTELSARIAQLRDLPLERLSTLTHSYGTTPIALFPLCRAELLAYVLAKSDTLHDAEPSTADDDTLLAHLQREHRELLLANLAAAMFWIDELAGYFVGRNSGFTHAFLFSGSMIYTRVLMEMCKRSETQCMVLESTFTGHQYHFEERYLPLCAGADIQLATVRNAHWAGLTSEQQAERRAQATRSMFRATNKNVVQPRGPTPLTFAEPKRPELLVVGQVVNDFSIIERRGTPLSAPAFYKRLITRCLDETDYNIVFKAHPWERRKQWVDRPLTFDALRAFRATLSTTQQARLAITDEANMLALGARAQRVALLSSQAALELAFHCGLRPSTFAHPYYEAAGFTDDYDDIEAFVASVRTRGHSALLDLHSYDALLDFLACFLVEDCVNDDASGVQAIARKLPITRDATEPLRKASEPALGRLGAKARKLLRDPRRFVRDSRVLHKLLKK